MAMKIDYEVAPGMNRPVSFTMTRPDDMHLHIRDGVVMAQVIGHSARRFGRAIIMPNLKPPVTMVARARSYHQEINVVLSGIGLKENFQPLMTLYLTDNTSPEEIDRAVESGIVHAVKYYPAGATTNSDAGVTDIEKVYPVLDRMEKLGMVLCVHGEVTDPNVDVFDRETICIRRVLEPLRENFPVLKIVFEHITTGDALHFIGVETNHHRPTAATITAHHLLENRNAMFKGGFRPHHYCLPVLKREEDRRALLLAATSGSPHFFLGTDSAPHPKHLKENACGCAGCFTAPIALELYAEAFSSVGKLDKLEGFASNFGADFYGLPRNTSAITLVREEWKVRDELPFGNSVVVPFRAGEMAQWKIT